MPQMAEMRAGENSGRKYQGVGANSGGGGGKYDHVGSDRVRSALAGERGKGKDIKMRDFETKTERCEY